MHGNKLSHVNSSIEINLEVSVLSRAGMWFYVYVLPCTANSNCRNCRSSIPSIYSTLQVQYFQTLTDLHNTLMEYENVAFELSASEFPYLYNGYTI